MLDVKNYEAFRELVDGNMMSSTEGTSSSSSRPVGIKAVADDHDRVGIHRQPLVSCSIIG